MQDTIPPIPQAPPPVPAAVLPFARVAAGSPDGRVRGGQGVSAGPGSVRP